MDSNDRIVVIGEADSFWTKRYIEYVLLPLSKDVLLITPKNNQYASFYENNKVNVLLTYGQSFLYRIPKLNTACARLKLLKFVNKQKDSTIVIQYAFPSILNALKRFDFKKLIITYWGSDLYRVNKEKLISVSSVVQKAERIVVMTKDMKTAFTSQYPSIDEKKVCIIDMGVSAFEEIEKKLHKRNIVKKKVLSKYSDRFAITIGYNADPKQQHDKVLNVIAELPEEVKDKIVLLLPMTYRATDQKYLEKVNNLLADIKVPSIVFKEFMDDEHIAEICVSTDLFINSQTTDALSSSMLEQLFAGSKMYSGNWLKYSFLDENGIEYYTFNNFASLGMIIINEVENYGSIINARLVDNTNRLKDKCSWEATKDKWNLIL